jgi:acetoacetyl-CoA synthetase
MQAEKIGLIECDERGVSKEINWQTILNEASQLQKFLDTKGLIEGDRVVAYLPNIKEASIAFLTCAASGWIWSVCSPDFGDAVS